MKNPKERFEELEKEIEYRKSELVRKGKHANFDYTILVLKAEMKGIAETMEYVYCEKQKTKEDSIKGKAPNRQRRLYNEEGKCTCCHCKQTKLAEEFSKNTTKWNGLDSFCKICRREYQKKWKKEKKEIS